MRLPDEEFDEEDDEEEGTGGTTEFRNVSCSG